MAERLGTRVGWRVSMSAMAMAGGAGVPCDVKWEKRWPGGGPDVRAAGGGMRPKVSAAATGQFNEPDRQGAASDTSLPLTLGLTASQALYDGGRTRNAIDGAIHDVSAGRADLLSLEQQVQAAVVALRKIERARRRQAS